MEENHQEAPSPEEGQAHNAAAVTPKAGQPKGILKSVTPEKASSELEPAERSAEVDPEAVQTPGTIPADLEIATEGGEPQRLDKKNLKKLKKMSDKIKDKEKKAKDKQKEKEKKSQEKETG